MSVNQPSDTQLIGQEDLQKKILFANQSIVVSDAIDIVFESVNIKINGITIT